MDYGLWNLVRKDSLKLNGILIMGFFSVSEPLLFPFNGKSLMIENENSFSKGILQRSHEQLVKIFLLVGAGWYCLCKKLLWL